MILSLADTNSVYCRRSNAPIITPQRSIVGSIVEPDLLKDVELTEKVAMKRHLGLFSGVCFIIGIIIGKDKYMFISIDLIFLIGSGIFVSPKGVLRETQSVALCLIVWVGCGLLSLLGSFLFIMYSGKSMFYRSIVLCRDWHADTKKWR